MAPGLRPVRPARPVSSEREVLDPRRPQRGAGGVVERAEHPGHVSERRALDPPLAERSRGLALEVDDDEVAAGPQDLAEVVVAVDADPLPADLVAGEDRVTSEELVLASEQLLDLGSDLVVAQAAERGHRLRAHRLVQRALVHARDRLGREHRVVGPRAEREVELRRPATEEPGRTEEWSDQVVGEQRRELADHVHDRSAPREGSAGRPAAPAPVRTTRWIASSEYAQASPSFCTYPWRIATVDPPPAVGQPRSRRRSARSAGRRCDRSGSGPPRAPG